MTNCHRIRWGALAASLSFSLLAGCRHADQRACPPLAVSADAEPSPKLNPGQVADVQIAMARTLEQHGQAEEATEQYGKALKLDPKRADAWLRLAIVFDRQGRFQESAEAYAKALEARPGEPAVYANLGYSLYLQGRWEEAERNLRQAVALRPEYGRAHNNLGLLLARTGRKDEALEEFEKAGCGPADARCNLAFALALERHLPEAREQYKQALVQDPSSAAARTGLRQVEAAVAKTQPPPAGGMQTAQEHPRDPSPAALRIQDSAVVPAAGSVHNCTTATVSPWPIVPAAPDASALPPTPVAPGGSAPVPDPAASGRPAGGPAGGRQPPNGPYAR